MVVVHRVEITILDVEVSQLQLLRGGDVFKETVELDFGQFCFAQVHRWYRADRLAQWGGGHSGQRVLAQIQTADLHLMTKALCSNI